jgi:serine protease Do
VRFILATVASAALATSAIARDPLPSFAPVLAKAEPAVVNVATTSGRAETGEPQTMQDFMRRFFGESPGVKQGLGSGFIISPDGEIVTNGHVVAGAERIRVRLATGEELDAKVVGRDDKTDVALLRVKAPRALPTLPLGDSDALQVGDWVLAIGNPFGLAQTATAGIVSAKGRFLGAGPYDDFIQTDASINPGNSGGPLIDQDGRVVGINAAIVAPAGGNVGIGFAVPIKLAQWVVGQLREHGSVVRGWVGIAVQEVTADLARSFGLTEPHGALVADVTKGGPADAAKIQRGDVIVAWGDRPIHESRDLPTLVAGTPPGTSVQVRLVRGGQEQTVEVRVAKMPEQQAQATGAGSAGVETAWGFASVPLSSEDARRLGLKPGTGVAVAEVEDGGPADDAGLQPGDVILQVGRRRVGSVADLHRALAASGDRATLLCRRGTTSFYVTLER